MGGSPSAPTQHADSMRFAVADEDRTVGVDEHAMKPVERAGERIAFRTVTFDARARHEFEHAGRCANHPHGMTFGVGEPGVALRVECYALGAAERREFRGTAVA